MVEADTINTFKNCLDKYWSNQERLFNSNADLIGTGSLPFSYESDVKMWAKRTTCTHQNTLDWIGRNLNHSCRMPYPSNSTIK